MKRDGQSKSWHSSPILLSWAPKFFFLLSVFFGSLWTSREIQQPGEWLQPLLRSRYDVPEGLVCPPAHASALVTPIATFP